MSKNKEKLYEIIEHAYNNTEAYNNIYRGKNLKNILDIDVIDQDFILSNYYLAGGDNLKGNHLGYNVFSTSGSSGSRKIVFRSFDETRISSELIYKGIKDLLNSNDKIAFMLHYGDLWAGAITFGQALQMTDSVLYSFGADISNGTMIDNIKKFRLNTLVCVPAQALSLANYIIENNIDIKVSKIITGGEKLFCDSKLTLRSAFNADYFYSLGYAMNETGPIGYQCKHLDNNEFHIHESHLYLEILDNLGKTTKNIGSIVITNLYFKLMPIIRYRTGDVGEIIFKKCQCGSTDKIIKLLDRDDKKFKIGDDLISLSSIDYEIKTLLGEQSFYTILASTDNSLDKITVILYQDNLTEDCINTLIENLYSISNLKEQYCKGMIHGISVEMEKIKNLRKNKISKKSLKFIDLRD